MLLLQAHVYIVPAAPFPFLQKPSVVLLVQLQQTAGLTMPQAFSWRANDNKADSCLSMLSCFGGSSATNSPHCRRIANLTHQVSAVQQQQIVYLMTPRIPASQNAVPHWAFRTAKASYGQRAWSGQRQPFTFATFLSTYLRCRSQITA